MKHVAGFLVWFVALWWMWMLLVGEWNAQEWVAAACAAGVASAVGEAARTRARAQPARGARVIAQLYSVVPMIVLDFGLLLWALVRRQRGEFRPAAAADPWTALLATYSPNAYVVTEDRLHRLVPFDKSESPARAE